MYHMRRIAKGHKPLCEIKNGLLTYSKGFLYCYDGTAFQELVRVKQSTFTDSFRIFERIMRKEPKAAIEFNDRVFVAFDDGVVVISSSERKIVSFSKYRKDYIHTSRFALIKDVEGFNDCVAYGEYFNNAKSEEVAVYIKRNDADWEQAYLFPPKTIRHIHALIPDQKNSCVYILTGDEDSESGIWKATDGFKTIVPLLVGDQTFRACIAFLHNNAILYATDIPSRQNKILSYDLESKKLSEVYDLPGSCTTGCLLKDKYMIFGTSVETQEPKNKSKFERIKYLFSYKLGAGIQDDYARLFLVNNKLETEEMISLKKDIFPVGLCQFGRINALYCHQLKTLFIYPNATKKLDGYLCALEPES